MCLLADTPIGAKGILEARPDSNCNNCGFTFSYRAPSTYQGHEIIKGVRCEIFIFENPIFCPECNEKLEMFYTPCGGQYALQLENQAAVTNEK